MKFSKRGFRAMAFGLVAVAGLAFASAASARGYFSVGVNVPGVSVGFSNHHSWVGVGGGYYGGYYAPAYYGPTYYAPAPVYYETYPTYYYSRPVVYRSGYYYRSRSYERGYDRGYNRGYYEGRNGYYDRGGYYGR